MVIAWLNFLALLLVAVAAGAIAGVLLGSAISASVVAAGIVALTLWRRHYRWMIDRR